MGSFAYFCLWIFVFAVPWERIIQIPGVSITTKVAGGLALGVALFSVVVSGRVRRWQGFHVAALLFVAAAGAGQLFFHGGERLPNKYFTYVQLVLVLWIVWELAPSRQRVFGLMTAYLLGAYVSAIDTLLTFRKEASVLRRFSAGGADGNDLAMTLALGIPMAWYLGMTYHRPIVRWICRAYLPVTVLAIGLTGSRGGMLATMVALLIVPLTMTSLSPAKLATTIVLLGLSGALAIVYIPTTIVERLASTSTEVQQGHFGGRFKLWVAGVHAFALKPVFGYGTAGYKAAITPELGDMAQVAHNSFLSVLVEQGLIGFAFYMLMLLAVLRAVLAIPPPERRFALILLGTLFVAMLPLTWEDQKVTWVILALLVGLAKAPRPGFAGVVRQPAARRAAPVVRPPMVARRLTAPGGRSADPDVSA